MVTDGFVETPGPKGGNSTGMRAGPAGVRLPPTQGYGGPPPGGGLAPPGPASLQRGLHPDQVAYLRGLGIIQQADCNWVGAMPDGGNDVGYLSGSRGKALVLTPKRLKYPLVWL